MEPCYDKIITNWVWEEKSSLEYFRKPILTGDTHCTYIIILDYKLLIADPHMFIGDPKRYIGDFKIFIGDLIKSEEKGVSLMKIWMSIANPGVFDIIIRVSNEIVVVYVNERGLQWGALGLQWKALDFQWKVGLQLKVLGLQWKALRLQYKTLGLQWKALGLQWKVLGLQCKSKVSE